MGAYQALTLREAICPAMTDHGGECIDTVTELARVRGSIDFDRPIDEVFDVVADQTNEPRYNPAMTASHRVKPGPSGWGPGSGPPS